MFGRAPMLGQVRISLGQRGGGGGGHGGGGGGGMVTGGGGPGASFSTSFGPGFGDFGWGWPYSYPNYYPQYPQQQNMVCKKDEKASEKEGTDVFTCTPQAPAYNYPVYQPYGYGYGYPVTYVRPWGWY